MRNFAHPLTIPPSAIRGIASAEPRVRIPPSGGETRGGKGGINVHGIVGRVGLREGVVLEKGIVGRIRLREGVGGDRDGDGDEIMAGR